jgi:hypothetical protein
MTTQKNYSFKKNSFKIFLLLIAVVVTWTICETYNRVDIKISMKMQGNTTGTPTSLTVTSSISTVTSTSSSVTPASTQKPKELKYKMMPDKPRKNLTDYKILFYYEPAGEQWLSATNLGAEMLKENHCEFTNCFFTSNVNYLSNVHDFDGIFFTYTERTRPATRSPHQQYVFTTNE